MRGKEPLASIGRCDSETRPPDEVARDIDWRKVRRVQLRLAFPHDAGTCHDEAELEERSKRRATRLAHLLASLAGMSLGLSILRGLDSAPMLALSSLGFALAAALSARCGLR